MNRRIVVAGLGLAVLVAGCGSSSSGGKAAVEPTVSTGTTESAPPTQPPVTSPPTSDTTPPQTTTSPPTSTTTSTTTQPASLVPCQSVNLKLSLGPSDGAAGTTYQEVVFTNKGTSSCTLHGFPGVSYVNGNGAIIGKPTTEDPGARITVVLAVDGKAHALLRQPDAGNFPPSSCHLTTADRLQVYPPGETHQLYVTDRTQVCATGAGRGGIGPIRAGIGSP